MTCSDDAGPEWTAETFARSRPFAETFPDLASKPDARKKKVVSIRLDEAVIEHFKATGDDWQNQINQALCSRSFARRGKGRFALT